VCARRFPTPRSCRGVSPVLQDVPALKWVVLAAWRSSGLWSGQGPTGVPARGRSHPAPGRGQPRASARRSEYIDSLYADVQIASNPPGRRGRRGKTALVRAGLCRSAGGGESPRESSQQLRGGLGQRPPLRARRGPVDALTPEHRQQLGWPRAMTPRTSPGTGQVRQTLGCYRCSFLTSSTLPVRHAEHFLTRNRPPGVPVGS